MKARETNCVVASKVNRPSSSKAKRQSTFFRRIKMSSDTFLLNLVACLVREIFTHLTQLHYASWRGAGP